MTIAKLREVHEKTHLGRLYRAPGEGPEPGDSGAPGRSPDNQDPSRKDRDGGSGNSDRGPAADHDPDDDHDAGAGLA